MRLSKLGMLGAHLAEQVNRLRHLAELPFRIGQTQFQFPIGWGQLDASLKRLCRLAKRVQAPQCVTLCQPCGGLIAIQLNRSLGRLQCL